MDCHTIREPADVSIYIPGKGTVLKEKSILAYQKSNGKILAFGAEAEQLAQKGVPDVEVTSPLCLGMVADYCVAAKFFALLIAKALGKDGNKSLFWNKKCRRVVVCMPKGITEVEKKAMEDLMRWEVRAKKTLIVDVQPEEFIRESFEKFSETYGQYDLIIGIAKDEPERYVEEMLQDVFWRAEEWQVPRERVCELLQTMAAGQD